MKDIRLSTVGRWLLGITAFVFAFLGFFQAGNSAISPEVIAVMMLTSAAAFGILAVLSLMQKTIGARMVGVAAAVAALYMVGFAIFTFQQLSSIQPPTF